MQFLAKHDGGRRSARRFSIRVRLTALLTLVAFTSPLVTPALAAAQPSGEPREQVSASDGATRDPSLHSPDDTPDATFGPLSAEHDEDYYDVAPSETLERIAGQGSGSDTGGSTPDPVVTTELPTGADKSGVTSKAINMPKGSGTIDGMWESFSAQLSTGMATFSVPFALPAARGGAPPSLGLSYSSSGGFLAAGVGWSLGVPFIARQTDRGLPKYDDRADWHENQDRF